MTVQFAVLSTSDMSIIHYPQMRRSNAFGRVCLSVCPTHALTSAILDLESSLLICRIVNISSEYL